MRIYPFGCILGAIGQPASWLREGILMLSIADVVDAPTEGSVVARPLIILEQPGRLTPKEPSVA